MRHGPGLLAMIRAQERKVCWSGTSYAVHGKDQGAAALVWAAWKDTASRLWLPDGRSEAFQALA